MEGRGLKLLFIKLKHIGDSLLLTPTLIGARQQYPDAEIWVVVRKSCERILAGCSSIDQLRTVAAPESTERSSFNWLEDWKLVREIRRKKFDYVFELSDGDRGRWMATLSGARLKCANARGLHWWWRRQFKCVSHYQWLRRHWVEKDYYTVHDCLSLPATVPGLSFEKKRAEAWLAIFGPSPDVQWRQPWKARHEIVTPGNIRYEPHDPDYFTKVSSIKTSEVTIADVLQQLAKLNVGQENVEHGP